MKRIFHVILFFIFGCPTVYADWVQGVVREIDVKNQVLTLQQTGEDKETHFPDQIKLKIVPEIELENVGNLDDLEVGNEVRVDIRENQNLGIWEVTAIEFQNERYRGQKED